MSRTTHTLGHLGQHVRRLGPLWATSCFSFESFYHYAVQLIHGTRYCASSGNVVSITPPQLTEWFQELF